MWFFVTCVECQLNQQIYSLSNVLQFKYPANNVAKENALCEIMVSFSHLFLNGNKNSISSFFSCKETFVFPLNGNVVFVALHGLFEV